MAKRRHLVSSPVCLSFEFHTPKCVQPKLFHASSVNAGFKGPGGFGGSGKCWQETPCAERPGGPFNTTHPCVKVDCMLYAVTVPFGMYTTSSTGRFSRLSCCSYYLPRGCECTPLCRGPANWGPKSCSSQGAPLLFARSLAFYYVW